MTTTTRAQHYGSRVGASYPAPTEQRARGVNAGQLESVNTSPDRKMSLSPIVLGPLLDPTAVFSAMRSADNGYMRRWCDMLSEIRESHPHLAAELNKRNGAVTALDWTMRPAEVVGKGKRSKAAKIADWTSSILRQAKGDEDLLSFTDTIDHLQDAVYFGRNAAETVFRREASKEGWSIRGWAPIAPKRLSYAKGDWRIRLWDENGNAENPAIGTYPGIDIRAELPGKVVVHEPLTLGGEVKTRQGLGRPLVYASMFWKWNARGIMQFAELFGNPWRWVEFSKNADDADIRAARQALIEMSGFGVATFPAGTTPKFLEAKDAKIYQDLHTIWNAEVSKVVTGGTLGAEVGSSGGNRALGEVQERGFEMLWKSDARKVFATIDRDVIKPLVALAFGVQASEELCPSCQPITERAEALTTRWGRVKDFVDRGGAVDADEVRTTFVGLSKPDNKAPLLVPMPAVAAFAKAKATEETAGDPADPTAPEDADPADETESPIEPDAPEGGDEKKD